MASHILYIYMCLYTKESNYFYLLFYIYLYMYTAAQYNCILFKKFLMRHVTSNVCFNCMCQRYGNTEDENISLSETWIHKKEVLYMCYLSFHN